MKIIKSIKQLGKKIKENIRNFILDESAGNLIEYSLLIGFALFIFFIIISVITSMLDWTLGQSNDFLDIIGGIGS